MTRDTSESVSRLPRGFSAYKKLRFDVALEQPAELNHAASNVSAAALNKSFGVHLMPLHGFACDTQSLEPCGFANPGSHKIRLSTFSHALRLLPLLLLRLTLAPLALKPLGGLPFFLRWHGHGCPLSWRIQGDAFYSTENVELPLARSHG